MNVYLSNVYIAGLPYALAYNLWVPGNPSVYILLKKMFVP